MAAPLKVNKNYKGVEKNMKKLNKMGSEVLSSLPTLDCLKGRAKMEKNHTNGLIIFIGIYF